MRIGIDIDDTITETHDYIIKKICKCYNLKKEQIDYMNYDQLQLNYLVFLCEWNSKLRHTRASQDHFALYFEK